MKNKAEKHNSPLIDEIFETISPKEERRVRNRMLLAAKIEDAMKAKGWTKKELVKRMGKKNPSEATKWFSGTHNFTSDTLSDFEEVLGINLLEVEEKIVQPVKCFVVKISQDECQPSWESPTNKIVEKTFSELINLSNITPKA